MTPDELRAIAARLRPYFGMLRGAQAVALKVGNAHTHDELRADLVAFGAAIQLCECLADAGGCIMEKP